MQTLHGDWFDGPGRDNLWRRGARFRRLVAISALLALSASMSDAFANAPRASASSSFGAATQTTWWFWTSNVPYSFTVYSGGNGSYNRNVLDGNWFDQVFSDYDHVQVPYGNAYWEPPDPLYVGTWLQYYEEGYNHVNNWGGQFYYNCLTSPTDAVACVGDHPNYDYFETMHVLHVYEGYPDSGCCTDQNTQWIK